MAFTLASTIKSYALEVSRSAIHDGKLDVIELCSQLGIEARNFEFKNPSMSGAVYYNKDEDKWNIFVNSNDSPRRKRFTIAHEIGHYISYVNGSLSKAYIESMPDGVLKDHAVMARANLATLTDQQKQAELEANEIAAELLMPEPTVHELAGKGKNIEQMADYFEVSESAMAIRLLNLGYSTMEAPTSLTC